MTDSSDHLQSFISAVGVAEWTLPVWCHMFALTLHGAASEWFKRLPEGQITSFEDLVAKLSLHFSQHQRNTRDPTDILAVFRRDNESIKDFITQFNTEGLKIGGVTEDMRRAGFRKECEATTSSGAYQREMACQNHGTYSLKQPKYTQTPKSPCVDKDTSKLKIETSRERSRTTKRNVSRFWSKIQPSADASAQTPVPRPLIEEKQNRGYSTREWTPMAKTPSQILATENVDFRTPKPIFKRKHLDKSKYCKFHEDIGHNTYDSTNLNDEIEKAVKFGKHEHLAVEARKHTKNQGPTKDDGPPRKQIKNLNIHMILGGRNKSVKW
ncbi:uncharacterized protein LOC143579068 [Bidens hawaiensis]|uniref:uncharacterized protein LOC143579068 n=1 Tax=Bidens hawaiensis TaxID=980011 RepID=UPI004049D483